MPLHNPVGSGGEEKPQELLALALPSRGYFTLRSPL